MDQRTPSNVDEYQMKARDKSLARPQIPLGSGTSQSRWLRSENLRGVASKKQIDLQHRLRPGQIIQVVTMPQSLVNERSGEVVEVPEGENLIGRGPLLKVKAVHHKLNGWYVSH